MPESIANVKKLSHHCSGITVGFGDVLQHLSVCAKLRETVSPMIEFGWWHILFICWSSIYWSFLHEPPDSHEPTICYCILLTFPLLASPALMYSSLFLSSSHFVRFFFELSHYFTVAAFLHWVNMCNVYIVTFSTYSMPFLESLFTFTSLVVWYEMELTKIQKLWVMRGYGHSRDYFMSFIFIDFGQMLEQTPYKAALKL